MSSRPPGLRLPTLVNYAALAARLVLSLGFSVVVARKLPPGEYGLWGVALSTAGTVSTPLPLLTWWAPRQAVWGRRWAGTTGLLMALAYSAVAALAFSATVSALLGWRGWILLGSLMTVSAAVNMYAAPLASASRPHVAGVSSLIFDSTRLAAAYLLLVREGMGLDGVFYAMIAGYWASTLYSLAEALGAGLLAPQVSLRGAARLLRLSHTLLPRTAAGALRLFYRSYLEALTHSLGAVARINVALSAETPLTRIASMASPALYARLLRRVGSWELEESIRLYLAFAAFTATALIVLARPVALLYNPAYVDAAPVLRVVAVYALLLGLGGVYSTAVGGAERFDYDIENPPGPLEALRRPWSRPGIAMLACFAGAYALLAATAPLAGGSPATLALAASLALLAASASWSIYVGRLAHSMTGSRFPLREALEIAGASAAEALTLTVLGGPQLHGGFWGLAGALALQLLAGALAYLGALLALSPWARGLAAAGLRRILGRG